MKDVVIVPFLMAWCAVATFLILIPAEFMALVCLLLLKPDRAWQIMERAIDIWSGEWWLERLD